MVKTRTFFVLATAVALPVTGLAKDTHSTDHASVSDDIIAQQRHHLAQSTRGKGFGPQSPRDIDSVSGNNNISFSTAPPYSQMNLCNIHFHKNA